MSPDQQFSQLKAAITGGQQAGAPDSPLGNFPEIQKYFGSDYKVAATAAPTAGLANQSDAVAQAAADAAKQKAQHEADMLNPNKYQQIPKQDGGYAFLAPNGQEISAHEYARITGQSEAAILKDSQNPVDQGFVNDYSNLQEFLNAVRNNDKGKVDAAIKAQPQLDKFRNNLPGLIQTFIQHYPTVYGLNTNGNQSVNNTYIPNIGAQVNNANNDASGSGIGG